MTMMVTTLKQEQVQALPTVLTNTFKNNRDIQCMSIQMKFDKKTEAKEGIPILRDYIVDENVIHTLYSKLEEPKDELEDYRLVITYPLVSTRQVMCNAYLAAEEVELPLMSNIIIDKCSKVNYNFFAPTGKESISTVIKHIATDKYIYNSESDNFKRKDLRYEFTIRRDSIGGAYTHVHLNSFINDTRLNNIRNTEMSVPLFTGSVMLDKPERNLIQVTQSKSFDELLLSCKEEEGLPS
jgi:hypothetical protein